MFPLVGIYIDTNRNRNYVNLRAGLCYVSSNILYSNIKSALGLQGGAGTYLDVQL